MNVSDYCNRDVVIVDKDQTPLDAAIAMRESRSGDVVVVDTLDTRHMKPIGLVSDRDIAIEIVAERIDPEGIKVADMLLQPLITINQNADLADCIKMMKRKAVRRLPVVDDEGLLVGIISVDDVIEVLTDDVNDLALLFNSRPVKESAASST